VKILFFFKLSPALQNSAQHGSLIEFLADKDKADNKKLFMLLRGILAVSYLTIL